MKKKFKYMHLLRGKPASFTGQQVTYSSLYVKKLCDTLKELRLEQKKSLKWRKEKGFSDCGLDYDYIKVMI